MADQNFDIPVTNGSYSGSNRAKSAVKSSKSGQPMTADTSGTPKSDQTDTGIKDGSGDLKQDTKPRVLDTNTKPAMGATNPNNVNPDGRPGNGASPLPTKNNKGQ